MRVINKISDDLIEIREYAKPNACFQTNEYPDNYDFVVLKKIINPFDLFNDNKTKDKEIERLKDIIKEAREYIVSQKLHKIVDTTGGLTYEERKLLEILDKVGE